MGGCLATLAASCACQCLSRACGGCKSKQGSLVPYFILFFSCVIGALILRYWGGPLLVHIYAGYSLHICDSFKCVGFGAVERISFALCSFFFLHGLLMFAPSCYKIDTQSWWTKLLGFVVLLVSSWFIPQSFFDVYVHIARVCSALFLILQIIVLIDFAYNWNESWTSEETPKHKLVIAISVLMYLASLAFLIVSFIYFGGAGCDLEKFFIAFTLICTFIFSLLSISNYTRPGTGGVLPAAFLTLYSYWILFSALSSDPSTCNKLNTSNGDYLHMIIGLVVAGCSISYAGYSVGTSKSIFNSGGSSDENGVKEELNPTASESSTNSTTADVERGADDEHKDIELDEVDADIQSNASVEAVTANRRFHWVMGLAAMYMCMLLTNWGSLAVAQNNPNSTYDVNKESMWIKIGSQWATFLLFVWSLTAHLLCKNRSFD